MDQPRRIIAMDLTVSRNLRNCVRRAQHGALLSEINVNTLVLTLSRP